MATIIRVGGADFSANAIGFLPPVANGLVGWWQFGGTLTASLRNLATGGANAAVDGSPVVNDAYIACTGNDRLQTAIFESTSMTLIAVARSADTFDSSTDRPQLIATYQQSAVPLGVSMMVGGGTAPNASIRLYAGYDDGTSAFTAGGVNGFDSWKMVAGVIESGVGRRIYDLGTGTTPVGSATSALTRAGAGLSDRMLRIGHGYSGNSGISDLAFAAVYSRALSAGELGSIYDFIKPILAARGVDV